MAFKQRVGSSSSFGADDDRFFVDDVSSFDPSAVKSKDEELLDEDDLDREQGALKLKDGLDVRYQLTCLNYFWVLWSKACPSHH